MRFSFLNCKKARKLKLKFVFLFSLLLSTLFSVAQNQPSSIQDNYAGILAVPSQPANIADNRYKLDINLFTTHYSIYNNYIALKGNTIGGWASETPWEDWVIDDPNDTGKTTWQDPEFQEKFLFERLDGNPVSVHSYNEIMLPSFLYTIDQVQAVAFTWRIRSILNIDGISEELATLIYRDLDNPNLWQQILNNPAIGIANMNWVEYSAGYARVIHDEHKHFVKVGGNLKMVQGMNAMYLQIEDFEYEVINVDTISIGKRRVNYGRSESWDPSKPEHYSYAFDSKLSPALDLGVVYEYRPNREKFKYDMDGEYDKWMNDKNKYKWRIGFSITDIGRLKFDKHPTSHDYNTGITNWGIGRLDPESMDDFDRMIDTTFTASAGDERCAA